MNATGPAVATRAVRAQGAAPLLVVDDVTLQYKTADHLVTATWKVGFEVHAADRYVLLGPSGCGKTTILKAIAGFMAPVAGTITLAGRTIERPGPDRMMVFQEFYLGVGETGRRSFRDVKSYRRRKRWSA